MTEIFRLGHIGDGVGHADDGVGQVSDGSGDAGHSPDPVLTVPPGTFVIAVGASGSGKSTFLFRFPREAVVSSDEVRHAIHGDASNHGNEPRVWATVYDRVHARLGAGLTAVLDSTAARGNARRAATEAARLHGAPTLLVVFDTPLEVCLRRNQARRDPLRSEPVPEEVVRLQHGQVTQLLKNLAASGADSAVVLTSELAKRVRVDAPMEAVERRAPAVPALAARPVHSSGEQAARFTIVGDVHGCLDELQSLLAQPALGDDRLIVFVGDLTDRGPDSLGVLRTVMDLCATGRALCVRGNHDDKLARLLDYVFAKGLAWDRTPLTLDHGVETTVGELRRFERQDPSEARAFADRALPFLKALPYHLVLDAGRLVVSHAGIPAHLIGTEGRHLRRYALFGDPTGEVDAAGLPIRRDLAETYRGSALNVHGHIPISPPATLRNNVANVDTSAVFGGALTALLYPECTFVSVAAARVYYAR